MARDPRNDPKYQWKFKNGDHVTVRVRALKNGKVVNEVRFGTVRRRFLPLADCRPEIIGTSLDGSHTEIVTPYTPGPNDQKLRYGVSVQGFRMFEAFEDELTPIGKKP